MLVLLYPKMIHEFLTGQRYCWKQNCDHGGVKWYFYYQMKGGHDSPQNIELGPTNNCGLDLGKNLISNVISTRIDSLKADHSEPLLIY